MPFHWQARWMHTQATILGRYCKHIVVSNKLQKIKIIVNKYGVVLFITKQTNIASQLIMQWWLFSEIEVTTFALQGYNTLLLCTDHCSTRLGNYSSSMLHLISLWNFDLNSYHHSATQLQVTEIEQIQYMLFCCPEVDKIIQKEQLKVTCL